MAWQFYYVAKIMLSAYRSSEHSRENLFDIRRRIAEEIESPTRLLCGLCISSTFNVGNVLNGSHLMAWAGQFLHQQEEQRCLVDFLQSFSERTKWPTYSSLERLQNRWRSSMVSNDK